MFYWCSTKNGGKCDPGRWNTNHKLEDCRADEIKAEREKRQKEKKDNDGKPNWLKANKMVIKKEELKAKTREISNREMKELLEYYEVNSLSTDSQDRYDSIHPSFDLEHCLRRRAQRDAKWRAKKKVAEEAKAAKKRVKRLHWPK